MLASPLLLLLLAVICEYSGIDLWLAGHFYDKQNMLWPLREHWLTAGLIHNGGRNFDKAVGLVWLITFIVTICKPKLKPWRKPLLFFFSATVPGMLLVSLGKNFTHIYAPWDLLVFSGDKPYLKLFDHVPAGSAVGHDFPAGHASGGYAFLSLYFFFRLYKPAWRFYGLFIGLFLGLLYGFGQQMRGAHFLSHDLFSLVICWYSSLTVYLIFYCREQHNSRQPQ